MGDALPPGDEPEVPPAQRQSAVWRHPDRDAIHALLPRRSSDWIAAWLAERYPTEDADGEPLPEARRHARLALSARAIERYRRRFLPELTPGVDILPSQIEDLIGRLAPPAPKRELDILDSLQSVALHNLSRAMTQDDELEMVQPLTLQAQEAAVTTALKTIEAKGKLGVEGYELAAVKQNVSIDQTTRALNVDVDLRAPIDPATGEARATEPDKLAALRDLLSRGPEETRALVSAARDQALEATGRDV